MKVSERAGCHVCFYWSGHSSLSNGDEIGGDCQRYPPLLAADDGLAKFPITMRNAVCGEFLHRMSFEDILDRPKLPSNKGADQ